MIPKEKLEKFRENINRIKKLEKESFEKELNEIEINYYSKSDLYKSREYCKSIKCPIQTLLDNLESNLIDEIEIKKFCKLNCGEYKFHQWLEENNYIIIKKQ